MTLKESSEPINNLNDLIKFKITLMASTIRLDEKDNKDLDELMQNSRNTKNLFSFIDFISEDKWIMNLCRGTHAIMYLEVPIKNKINQISSQINYPLEIRSIDDSSMQNYGSIILNRNLNLKLRSGINKRYFIHN